MKTRRATLLDTTYPKISDDSSIDNCQHGLEITQEENGIKKRSKKTKQVTYEETVIQQLLELITLFPELPALLKGPLRHLKVEPHYREPTCRLLHSPQAYRKTSKIRLTGNWIEKAGFITHERIRVIPINRMLIIIPEKKSRRSRKVSRK